MACFKGVYRALASTAVLMTLVSVSQPVVASDARISVTDADGQPLPNAVVEVYFPGGTSADTGVEQVSQRDAAFHPEVLAIPVRSQVEFPNHDTTRHHVYSFSPAKTFDLNLYLQETPPPSASINRALWSSDVTFTTTCRRLSWSARRPSMP